MPRDGNDIYSKPAGTTAVPNTVIESDKFNSVIEDIEQDLNNPRPISAGGTGATTAQGVRNNLAIPHGLSYPTIAEAQLAFDDEKIAVGDFLYVDELTTGSEGGFIGQVVASGGHPLADNIAVTELDAIPEMFGVGVNDGATPAQAAILAAQAKTQDVRIIRGNYLIDADTTITANIDGRGGVMRVADGVTVTMAQPHTNTPRQIFELLGTGKVQIEEGRHAYPEWWGDSADALQWCLEQKAPASKILLQKGEYLTNGIDFTTNLTVERGGATGTLFEGIFPQKYPDPNGSNLYYGTVIRLVAGADRSAVIFDNIGDRAHSSGGFKNVMIDGAGGSQATLSSDIIELRNGKDIYFENVTFFNANRSGLAATGEVNQLQLHGAIEAVNCRFDGIRGEALPDFQCSAEVRAVNCGRWGINVSKGNFTGAMLYAYFCGLNDPNGGGIRWANSDPADLRYLRSEDNTGPGLHFTSTARDLTIMRCHVPDNGVNLTGNGRDKRRSGVLDEGTNLKILKLEAQQRDTAVTTARPDPHQQQHAYYCGATSRGAVIGHVMDESTEYHEVFNAQTIFVDAAQRDFGGPVIGERRLYIGTRAEYTALTSEFQPLKRPDTYSRVKITEADGDVTMANVSVTQLPHGMDFDISISATANINAVFASNYRASNGTTQLGNVAIASGTSREFRFRIENGKFVQK